MPTATYNAAPSPTTVMGTDLNSLANDTVNVGGTIVDNTSNKHFYGAAELVLASVDLSAQTNPTVELYMVPSIDGTNYCDTGTDGSTTDLPPGSVLAGIFNIQETNASHRAGIEQFVVGPFKYTPVLINKTGAAFAATGNTLKIGTYTEASA